MLQEYKYVFQEEVSGLPSKRDIDFIINMVPRINLVAKGPYRMITPEMVELKIQL